MVSVALFLLQLIQINKKIKVDIRRIKADFKRQNYSKLSLEQQPACRQATATANSIQSRASALKSKAI
jgi:hypothetical protein